MDLNMQLHLEEAEIEVIKALRKEFKDWTAWAVKHINGRRRARSNRRKRGEKTKDDVVHMYRCGLSLTQIALALGINKSTAGRALRRALEE